MKRILICGDKNQFNPFDYSQKRGVLFDTCLILSNQKRTVVRQRNEVFR